MKSKKEKKHLVTTYLVTCDINNKNGWIEEHFSYGFAQQAKERAAEEGWFSFEELAKSRKTLKEIEAALVKDYGKIEGKAEFLAWKWENGIQ